jgi:hypothetical protein
VSQLADPRKKTYRSRLEVVNGTKEDAGEYRCVVTDQYTNKSASKKIQVFGKKLEKFRKAKLNGILIFSSCKMEEPDYRLLTLWTDEQNITIMRGSEARWVVWVDTFPGPGRFLYEWKHGDGNKIENGHKFSMEQKKMNAVVLRIANATLENAGLYRFTVRNGIHPKLTDQLFLRLIVHGNLIGVWDCMIDMDKNSSFNVRQTNGGNPACRTESLFPGRKTLFP